MTGQIGPPAGLDLGCVDSKAYFVHAFTPRSAHMNPNFAAGAAPQSRFAPCGKGPQGNRKSRAS